MIFKTELGELNGIPLGKSDNGKTVYEFHSIPYAKAKRFEKPILIDDYENGKPINMEDTVCFPQHGYPLWLNRFIKHHMMRPEFLPTKDTQTEDAFVVNIWTDDLNGNKPVTIFLHGGGEGSGTVPMYTGGNLAKKDIVSVTVTYRIGCFGYMPTFDRGQMTANLAYFDQQAALLWIKKNIQHFGGDPANITLIGHCGGALAALYHFLNPISQKCFDKLMLLCGNLPTLTPRAKAESNYPNMLKHYKCSSLENLKSLPSNRFLRRNQIGMGDVHDGEFFIDDPNKLMECRLFPSIPILIGTNADEFSMIELPMYYKVLGIATKEKNVDDALTKKYGSLASMLKSAFVAEANGAVDLQVKIMELLVFHNSAYRLLETVKEKCPVYGYRLNFVPDLYNGRRGSYHGAELSYFFDNFDKVNIPYTKKNKMETAIIQKDWLQFVRNGIIEGRERYDETERITNYDTDIEAIRFPKVELLKKLSDSDIFENVRRSYISGMNEEPTGKV